MPSLKPISYSLLLFLGISLGACAEQTEADARPDAHSRSPIGMNVGSITDWSSNLPFVDLFKMSRPFSSAHPQLELDEQGWVKRLKPREVGETYIAWNIDGLFPTGEYTVLYDGDGILKYGGGARMIKHKKGFDRINVNSMMGGIHLKIVKTNARDPVRNIRVLLPGGICKGEPQSRVETASQCPEGDYLSFRKHYKELIFNPDFLRFMSSFSVLRFMDFMRINNSEVVHWSDRTPLDHASWAVESGAPVEIMVELANQTNRDPWFTMPHQADDNYVRQFARYTREHLKPGLKAYVEYSNEAWNGAFKQFRYMIEKGQALKLDNNEYQAGFKYYSKRAVEIFKIWEQEMEDNSRLVRVMSGQAANAYIPELSLKYEEAYKHTDAIAIAPYFGGYLGAPDKHTEKMSIYDLFKELRSTALPQSIEWMKAVGHIAKKYKVDMIAYEGGHHLTGITGAENNRKLNKLFDKADKNPQMRTLYERYFNEWKKAGGKLFVYYSAPSKSTKWGRWGITESLYEPRDEAPKYDAVLDFIEHNPRWW
ncbi:MAG: hypothetical protein ACWA5X_05590 [bacterium]